MSGVKKQLDLSNRNLRLLQLLPGAVAASLVCVTLMQASRVSAQGLEAYGLAHISADRIETGQRDLSNLASNSSRLGVRGEWARSEQLALIYQYESGVDLTLQGGNADGNGGANDGNILFTKTRPSFIGVDTPYGKLVYGHIDWLDQWANEFNMFADQVGDLGNFWAASGFPGRLDDVIYYRSPDALPGYVSASYRPKNATNSDAMLLKAGYQFDDWTLSATHTEIEQGSIALDEPPSHAQLNAHSAQIITLYHRGETIAFGGGVQHEVDAKGVSDFERTSYTLGGSIQLDNKSRVRALIATTLGATAKSDAQMWAVGYDYLWGKHLTLYADAAGVNNEINAAFSVNSKGHGQGTSPQLGDDQFVVSIGFVATFTADLFD